MDIDLDPRNLDAQETAWTAFSWLAAAAVGLLVREVISRSWEQVMDEEPPMNPASPDVHWGEAVAWSVSVGIAVGLARLFTKRGAASWWRELGGSKQHLKR